MSRRDRRLEEARAFYAALMAATSGSVDPRLARVFESVPREAFVGPGPWQIMVQGGAVVETPSADPIHLYQNVLVVLDRPKGINNGEPFLHAGWLGAATPQPGETVCHIGAGTGYYTALLAMLVLPGGQVTAFEFDERLAAAAKANLQPFDGVSVRAGDATVLPLPPSDLIYVNAGVVAPPPSWLEALRPGGRMIFPWRPSESVGLALRVTRTAQGFAAKVHGGAWFIPCAGASDAGSSLKVPSRAAAWSVRSVWLTRDRAPDGTAVAVYPQLWLSSAPLDAPS
ncbi:MAG: protein-L-isoaspartate O-methyltransferase [Pseudomonadota bacterium]|jgi:protein-L-isoaspartate(D-aspartate) O-methyltransferase